MQSHDKALWTYPIDRPTYRFLVDPDRLFDELKHQGALAHPDVNQSPFQVPADSAWGTRELHVRDPDGNGLQFYRVR